MATQPAPPGPEQRRGHFLIESANEKVSADGGDWSELAANPAAWLGIWPGMRIAHEAFDYWVDAWQRSVLTLDVLRQRGNNHVARRDEKVPNVLNFRFEPV